MKALLGDLALWVLRLLVWSGVAGVVLLYVRPPIVLCLILLVTFAAAVHLVALPADPAARAALLHAARVQRPVLKGSLLLLAAPLTAIIALALDQYSLQLGLPQGGAISPGTVDAPASGLYLLAIGLGPVVEEYVFRGQILRRIEGYGGSRRAVVLSALIFTAVHASPAGSAGFFLLGIVTGAACVAADSLWVAVGIHVLFNALISLAQVPAVGRFLDTEGVLPLLAGVGAVALFGLFWIVVPRSPALPYGSPA